MTNSKIAALALVAALATATSGAWAKGGSGGGHSSSSSGSHAVSGYTKSNGTYVAPSHATNPNATKTDNYTTKGNTNPYTGKAGTVDPYAAPAAGK